VFKIHNLKLAISSDEVIFPKRSEYRERMSEIDKQDSNTDEPDLLAVNVSKEKVVLAHRVAWAGTSAERRHGLLGRSELHPEEGMYIAPCQWIHTFGMKFPIDVLFLAKNGRVMAIHHSLRPFRLSRPVLRAQGVLELAAGRAKATNTEIGDIVEFWEEGMMA
jgi:uncharacterized membrane protein (UPF0127 family)